ncbi:MAG: hypothetical protein ABI315_03150 [Bacteroidia bacterium]
MKYLKCNNCGHLNEVKTEYLMLCSKCNKKLENNYSDWKKRNSDKSFDDYKNLICTTEINEASPVKTKSNKTKGLKYWIGFAFIFAIFYAVGQLGGEKIVGLFRKPVYDKAMMKIANEINKSCPVMVDSITRLDNAVALPGNVFQYNYTGINMVKESVDIEAMKNYLEPTTINFVKTNPDMQMVRDNKVTVNYYYKDKKGVYLFTISVTPEKYE